MLTGTAGEFRAAMIAAGMSPPEVIETARFYRFAGIGKRNGNKAGWCKLFADGMGGIYGDFSTGMVQSWHVERHRAQSLAEREAFRKQVELAKAEAEDDRQRTQLKARERVSFRMAAGRTRA